MLSKCKWCHEEVNKADRDYSGDYDANRIAHVSGIRCRLAKERRLSVSKRVPIPVEVLNVPLHPEV